VAIKFGIRSRSCGQLLVGLNHEDVPEVCQLKSGGEK
jgi:hypothetical protein